MVPVAYGRKRKIATFSTDLYHRGSDGFKGIVLLRDKSAYLLLILRLGERVERITSCFVAPC
jgi:hypothetical protein